MTSSFKRTDRIAEMMQRKLASIIQQEVKDSHRFITISAVTVSKDLSHAKVYFTVFNEEPSETAAALNKKAPYLRTLLAKGSTLRTMPQLHFVYDESIEYGKHLSDLIDQANASDSPNDEKKE